ncbi:MAG: halocarboxylic acid dehydrogenase DehI family protein, partial [Terriglobales bacterium]
MPWRKGNRLRTIAEEQADPATRGIYGEIKAALSLPGLQLYYPAIAAYPRFLELHWEMVHNVAHSRELFAFADRLRADAYTRVHNYFHVPNLRCGIDLSGPASLTDAANFFHYRDPLILLLFIFQLQAMEGPTGKPPDGGADAVGSSEQFKVSLAELPVSLSEQDAPAPVRRKYEEIRRTLDIPFVPPELCAFAMRPEFLDAYWNALKQMLASPLYPACKHGVRASAWSLAAQLPGPTELGLEQMGEAGLSAEEIASVARILDLFVEFLSGSLLNVAAAKIA